MTTTTKFQARHGTIAYVTSPVTYDTASALSAETFTANESTVKDISIEIPELSYEEIKCLGATAQTIGANARTIGTATGPVAGKFQNAAMQITAAGVYKMTGKLVLTGDEQGLDILGLGTPTVITGGSSRYAVGSLSTTTNAWDRTFTGAFRLYLNNGSEAVAVVMANAHVKIGAISPTGADGHWERDIEIVSLAHDGAVEFLD